jgi:O-antigen/teichoic acid export membrane protein
MASRLTSGAVGTLARSGANMGVRAAGLVGRFALTLYLAKYFELTDIGTFGLITGMAGLLPVLIGLGVNYFFGRELVGAEGYQAGRLLRDRLVLTVTAVGAVSAVAGVLALARLVHLPANSGLLFVILATECVCFDIHIAMIGLRMPVIANFLLFVRSASWIFVVILAGALHPGARTLHTVLFFWAGGELACLLSVFFFLRSWPLGRIARTPIDHRWLLAKVRNGWLIYLSDLGIAGQLYIDRYVVDYFLGLRSTGVYTLYWSIANSIHVLVTVGVIQISLPDLVDAHRKDPAKLWWPALLRELTKVMAIAVPLAVLSIVGVLIVLPRFGLKQFSTWPLLYCLMLVGIVARLAADTLNYGLYSSGRDTAYAVLNIVGIGLSAGFSIFFVSHWGLLGVTATMIAVPTTLFLCRGALILSRRAATFPTVTVEGVPAVAGGLASPDSPSGP